MSTHRLHAGRRLAGLVLALGGAVARYDDLRQRYYGGFAYDFQSGSLDALATRLFEADPAAALAFLQLNLRHNPETTRTHRLLGEAYALQGDTTAAVNHLRRSLELEPQNTGARQRLQQLGAH